MLQTFDWLRRVQSGPELLGSLRQLAAQPTWLDQLTNAQSLPGPVPNALTLPCSRCWLYPRLAKSTFCGVCRAIRHTTHNLGDLVKDAFVAWGFVNWLPNQVRMKHARPEAQLLGAYTPDKNHFLVMVHRRHIQGWLQEMLLYHGTELKGNIQLFPTRGLAGDGMGMGDILCRAIGHDAYFPLDRLRVRLYTRSYQVLRPHDLDREGILTFDAAEFLGLLEMAGIFRAVLFPEEQEILYDLLLTEEEARAQFYWGRFMGMLNQQGRDLLEAWAVREWPTARVKFFYELTNYVDYQPTL